MRIPSFARRQGKGGIRGSQNHFMPRTSNRKKLHSKPQFRYNVAKNGDWTMEVRMTASTGLVTVEEFLKLPDPTEGHLELHHGEVIILPPPKRGHQRIQRKVQALLIPCVGETGVVEVEMAFRPSPEHEVWQADVAYISREHDAATPDDAYLVGAPELVVEVLSPGNTAEEIEDKRLICMENGCVSFWVVNGKRQTVSVTEGSVTRHYGPSETIVSSVLPISIAVDDVFA
jgi:Uma2 family endonuclease